MSAFWRATAAGFLLGSVMIAAVLFSRWAHDDAPPRQDAALPYTGSVLTSLRAMKARGCTDTWTATATTNWMQGSNWSSGRVPGEEDRACIPDGALVSLAGVETSIASAAVEGTLTLDRGAKLALSDRGRPSSIEVLVLRKATITGHSPLTVTGTLTWGNGGRIEGDAPLLLARGSSTTFDPGDGGNGLLRRPSTVIAGRFDLVSGALYLVGHVKNTGAVDVRTRSDNGYPAGILGIDGRPPGVSGKTQFIKGGGPIGTPGDGSVRTPPPLTPAGAARPPDQNGR